MYTEYEVPLCPPFPRKVELNEVLWNYLPVRCQSNLIILISFIVLLSLLTTACNLMILVTTLATKARRIRKRNPTMHNYSTYVVSLAAADLLVGSVVLPLCLVVFYVEYWTPWQRNSGLARADHNSTAEYGPIQIPEQLTSNLNLNSTISTSQNQQYTSANYISDMERKLHFSSVVKKSLGFFTHLTLFVSMYTIVTASADRCYAATHAVHLRTKRWSVRSFKEAAGGGSTSLPGSILNTITQSTVAVAVVWFFGLVFASLPLLPSTHFHFEQIGHIFVAMSTTAPASNTALIWYAVTLAIPLLTIWTLNLMICFSLWRRKFRRHLQKHRNSTARGTLPSDKQRVSSIVKNDKQLDSSACGGQVGEYNRIIKELKSNKKPNAAVLVSSNNCGEKGIIRRRMSSVRRARVLLRAQSYEGSITKTLLVVVIAFTVAVLPLIICLAVLWSADSSATPKETSNQRISAIVLAILLLFINSFINSVIYGSKMKDFSNIFVKFFQSIKKNFEVCGERKSQSCVAGASGAPLTPQNISVRGFRQRCKTLDECELARDSAKSPQHRQTARSLSGSAGFLCGVLLRDGTPPLILTKKNQNDIEESSGVFESAK